MYHKDMKRYQVTLISSFQVTLRRYCQDINLIFEKDTVHNNFYWSWQKNGRRV